jgi:hypothetical protein
LLTLVTSAGLWVMATAYMRSRHGQPGVVPLFWLGLLLVYVPIAGRLLGMRADRRERISLCLLLCGATLAVHVLSNPTRFVGFDEMLHVATLRQIWSTGQVFGANSLLPVSPYYPGLELATTAVEALTGSSSFVAGVVVLLAARVVLGLALFLLVEHIVDSPRAGGLAVVVYAASPQFVFFNSQYAYQSLALPLALTVLCLAAYASDTLNPRRQRRLVLAELLALATLAVTHHLTGVVVVALLLLWAAVPSRARRAAGRDGRRRDEQMWAAVPGWMRPRVRPWSSSQLPDRLAAFVGMLLVIGWAVLVGQRLAAYLNPIFSSAYDDLAGVFTGTRAGRGLFVDGGGVRTPPWERVVMLASVALLCLGIPPAAWSALRRRSGHRSLMLILTTTALLFPALQLARLTRSGAEVADRTSTFVFLGIAAILGLWLPERATGRVWRAVLLGGITVVFMGQVLLGSGPDWARVPGPYLVSADSRSIDAEALAAAEWAARSLPPGSRFAADRVNGALLGAVGGQRPVTGVAGGSSVADLYFSPTWGQAQDALVRRADIRYVLVDDRLATGRPHVGVYFEDGENGVGPQRHLTRSTLAKFASVPGASLVYDGGPIRIYDLQSVPRASVRVAVAQRSDAPVVCQRRANNLSGQQDGQDHAPPVPSTACAEVWSSENAGTPRPMLLLAIGWAVLGLAALALGALGLSDLVLAPETAPGAIQSLIAVTGVMAVLLAAGFAGSVLGAANSPVPYVVALTPLLFVVERRLPRTWRLRRSSLPPMAPMLRAIGTGAATIAVLTAAVGAARSAVPQASYAPTTLGLAAPDNPSPTVLVTSGDVDNVTFRLEFVQGDRVQRISPLVLGRGDTGVLRLSARRDRTATLHVRLYRTDELVRRLELK